MQCGNCGRELAEDHNFCDICGNPVNNSDNSGQDESNTFAPETDGITEASPYQPVVADETAQEPEFTFTPEPMPVYEPETTGFNNQPVFPAMDFEAPVVNVEARASAPEPPRPFIRDGAGSKPVPRGQFFVLEVLSMIPVLNLIVLLIAAFSKGNPSRASYAQAKLILKLVIWLIALIAAAIVLALMIAGVIEPFTVLRLPDWLM